MADEKIISPTVELVIEHFKTAMENDEKLGKDLAESLAIEILGKGAITSAKLSQAMFPEEEEET